MNTIKVPQAVQDHCAKFKCCAGCYIHCTNAPVEQEAFNKWLLSCINLVEKYLERKRSATN